jgi:NAD(P)-dependent dehydrogenase (short-subunit alcohol dehydrogenase family)
MNDTTRDLIGKTIVVTGSNTGLGRVTAEVLAGRGAMVILANRSEERTRPVLDGILAKGGLARFHALDLSRIGAAKESAERLLDSGPVHVLVNNAGVAGTRGLSDDGFELTFAVNHLGPLRFTLSLLPALELAAKERGEARVVNVASRAHKRVKRLDFDALTRPTRTPTGFPEYAVSKLANVYASRELSRHLGERGLGAITTYAVHPGVVASDIWRRVPAPFRWLMTRFMITNEEGAKTQIWCSSAPELRGQTGLYYAESRGKGLQGLGNDETLARELWERSLRWVGEAGGPNAAR